MSAAAPAYAVVLEWDNVRERVPARVQTVLRALAREIDTQPEPAELISVFDPALVRETHAQAALEAAGLAGRPALDVRHLACPQGRYYELKNAGARAARAEQLVFLDSDVVPEPGWLAAHREALGVLGARWAAGHTPIDSSTLYGKAVALGWVFESPAAKWVAGDTQSRFMANNFSCLRAQILATPFPHAGGVRGACDDVARRLRAEGVSILAVGGARATHPPPPGLSGFLCKAWAEGRDRALRRLRRGMAWHRRLSWPLEFWAKALWRSTSGIVGRQKQVGLSWVGVPWAALYMVVFWTLAFVAAGLTAMLPRIGARIGPH